MCPEAGLDGFCPYSGRSSRVDAAEDKGFISIKIAKAVKRVLGTNFHTLEM